MRHLFLLTCSLLILGGCQERQPKYALKSTSQATVVRTLQEHSGKKLMETYCYVCHSPDAPQAQGRIGPPMVAVKAHYMMGNPSRKEFTNAIESFVKEPSTEKSRMPGAVNRFGLMPYQQFPDSAIARIAEYMYDYQIEEPEWFADHWKDGPGKGMYRQQGRRMGKGLGMGMTMKNRQSIAEKGMEIALSTQKVLGSNLMQAIQTGGTLHAIEFCNIRAIPLTDSMAVKHNATINRVSDRHRNPENTATEEETSLITMFQRQIDAGTAPRPVIIPTGSKTRFYYPIVTNSMCLQCHGDPGNMTPEVREGIMKLYPEDNAVGYSENEVRGLWKVDFED